jgi:hypothetical protein
MEGKTGIPTQVRPLSSAGHRSKSEIAPRDLALDTRDTGRAIGTQRRDRLVPTGIEQPPHLGSELWLGILDALPRRHGDALDADVRPWLNSPGADR